MSDVTQPHAPRPEQPEAAPTETVDQSGLPGPHANCEHEHRVCVAKPEATPRRPTETPAGPVRTYEQGFADGRSAALTTAIREFINGEKPTATDAAWDECARRIANRIRALKPEGETSNA